MLTETERLKYDSLTTRFQDSVVDMVRARDSARSIPDEHRPTALETKAITEYQEALREITTFVYLLRSTTK